MVYSYPEQEPVQVIVALQSHVEGAKSTKLTLQNVHITYTAHQMTSPHHTLL